MKWHLVKNVCLCSAKTVCNVKNTSYIIIAEGVTGRSFSALNPFAMILRVIENIFLAVTAEELTNTFRIRTWYCERKI